MEFLLSFYLLTLLSSLSPTFSQYALPDHYFINCGSNAATTFTGRDFVGDANPTSFSVSGGRVDSDNNSSTPLIYRTARIFNRESGYELQPDQNNTFLMVNLHFHPFSSQLLNSRFDVSVYGVSLLSNFNVQNTTVKQFFIPVQSDQLLKIVFRPTQPSSVAFINAIEAFTTPSQFFSEAPAHISPAGKIGDFQNLKKPYALNPIHRINVGGQEINVESDTMRRSWVPDDEFIYNSQPALNRSFGGRISYQEVNATESDAPGGVYNTAKQLNTSSDARNNLFNVTWNFGVPKDTMYLVRAHFCDIISTGLRNPDDAFNFYVYTQFQQSITPVQVGLAVPFYVEFVVESVDSGFVNISIGNIRSNNQTAFLNGLEIMELLEGLNSPGQKEGQGNGIGKKRIIIIVGCVVGGVACVLILLVGFCIGLKFRKVKKEARPEWPAVPSHSYGGDSYTSINTDGTVNNNNASPLPNLNLRVPFTDILLATNNFDPKLMIGKGGFGKVYRGTLPNGMKWAVKRGEGGHGQGRPEFVREIMVLSKIRHRHLVSLIGYCDERSEMILVYEFMENGTLQEHLYSLNENQMKLPWSKRLEICITAAQGLQYLHTGADGVIIHRDVKSTNILLDEHFVAKVADFGISLLDQSEINENSDIKGSFGYLDPEYVQCLKLTQKSDVYSFGVVLLEVLCARPALDNRLPQREANLADWAVTRIKNGEAEEIVDPFLAGKINTNSLRKFLETVEKCLKYNGDERPTMIDVVWDLEYALQLQQTAMVKEPHEDSTISGSLQLPLTMLHQLPTDSVIDYSEENMKVNDRSSSKFQDESEVFSQLKIDDAR